MNDQVMEYIRSKRKAVVLAPGDSFPGLTSATTGTFMLNDDNKIVEVLLATSPGESVEEVADFFIDMIFVASDPAISAAEVMSGLRGSANPIISKFFMWTLSQEAQEYIRDRVAKVISTIEVGFDK